MLGLSDRPAERVIVPPPPSPHQELKRSLRQRTPHVRATYALFIANVAIFALMVRDAGSLGFSPPRAIAWGALSGPAAADGQWWRLLTATFLHAHLPHLVLNMLGLLLIGPTVERLVGPRAFLAFYIACALAGSAAGLLVHPFAVSAGASGAILGMYGLLLGAMIVRRRTGGDRDSAASPPLPRSRVGLHPDACIFMLVGAVADWWVPAIDTAAHAGGTAAGVLFGCMLRRRIEWSTPSGRQIAMALGIALVCCAAAAALVRPAMSTHRAMVRVFETESHINARVSALNDGADPQAVAALIESEREADSLMGRLIRTRLD